MECLLCTRNHSKCFKKIASNECSKSCSKTEVGGVIRSILKMRKGFPVGSDGEESTCNAGDPGSISGSGKTPGKGNGWLLQYSCPEKSTDREGRQAAVHGVEKTWTQMKWPTLHFSQMRKLKETHREEGITARIKVRSEYISKPKLFYNTLPPSNNTVKMPVSSLINRWPTGPRQPQSPLGD